MARTARTIIHKRKTSYPGEVIVEFSSRAGQEHNFAGGLISIRPMTDGTVRVEVYREDAGVRVVCDARHAVANGGLQCDDCGGISTIKASRDASG